MTELERTRRDKDRAFRESPHSPIEDRAAFRGLSYYPEAPELELRLELEHAEEGELVELPTSAGGVHPYVRSGLVHFELDGRPQRLTLFAPAEGTGGSLFVPFRDPTNGAETYGAGRYLDAELLPDGRVRLDFNRAYHPFCAYSERYRCPFPPPENHLDVPVRAGERLPGPEADG